MNCDSAPLCCSSKTDWEFDFYNMGGKNQRWEDVGFSSLHGDTRGF